MTNDSCKKDFSYNLTLSHITSVTYDDDDRQTEKQTITRTNSSAVT